MNRFAVVCCAGLFPLLSPVASAAEPSPAGKSLAEEMRRLSPVEPRDALKTFRVEHGFRMQLVAHEPLVADPVDACFDADGRMYVAEMHGYPYSHEPRAHQPKGGGKKDAGIVRLLEDTDGDGVFDRSVIFAQDISWPTSVCCYDGGVFVLAPLHLYYFKDTDGDDVADVREIVYSGFGRQNVQALANNLKWGLDNRIYGASASNPAELTHRGQPLLTLGRRDFAFDPKTEELEPVTGGAQFGRSMDDWGNWFICSNSNHIQHVVFEQRYLDRNPNVTVSGVVRSIAKEGPAAPVFRRSPAEPWRIVRTRRRASDPAYAKRLPESELVPTGFFTSATGVTIYRGGAYPEEFRGNAFIGDVGGNLIHRKTLTPSGATFIAERADRNTEFVTSTDTWFRPVNFVNAPDGTLYVLDMYRETIEHPVSIPEDIKAHLDLESGDQRGRIYRLAPPDWQHTPPPKLGDMTAAELVAQLESPNSWNRQTAQRLLWERQDKAAVEPLRKLVRSSKSPLAALHALYTLSGLDALTADVVTVALSHDHPGVREHAVQLAVPFAASAEVRRTLEGLVTDDAYRVRLQLAFSAGDLSRKSDATDETRMKIITGLLDGSERELQTALLTSVARPTELLGALLALSLRNPLSQEVRAFCGELARLVGSGGTEPQALHVLKFASAPLAEGEDSDLRDILLRSLGQGLRQRGLSISKLLASSKADPEVRQGVSEFFRGMAVMAADEGRTLAERRAAAGLLALADFEIASAGLVDLLAPTAPQSLQTAAVQALADHTDPAVAEALLESWRSYSPTVRREVVDALLRRPGWIESLLAAIESGGVKAGEIERDKQELLKNHPNDAVRGAARKLFAAVTTDRAKIVETYQKSLDLKGDAARGREVFVKNCTVCHKTGETGHQVGPELASVKNKSAADLLIAILDPNREAQPNFVSYNVLTREGKLYNGIIVAETAGSLTLRRAEGKEDVVLRSQIDELLSSGKSLMPEGVEKEITPAEMADLLEFVRTLPAAP